VVRRGLSEKVKERLTTPNERQLRMEVLTRRVAHFTRGVMLGSRAFVDGWFEGNRHICRGRSRTESFEPEDLFHAHIGGMDAFARGLKISCLVHPPQLHCVPRILSTSPDSILSPKWAGLRYNRKWNCSTPPSVNRPMPTCFEHGAPGIGSVVVEEEERALRTMAAYIDLNPVRAGIVEDPADYRWSGYAEAMLGKARARRGLVRIIGQMAWPRETLAGAQPRGEAVFPKAVETRALVFYRAILGGKGAARKREDGTVIRRGVSEKVRERLTTPNERRLALEVLTRRVQHFTKGAFLGSRSFMEEWFERNRDICQGRSRTERKRGAKSLGRPALRGLYVLRDARG
jgi:hypothetical protein